MKTPFVPCRQTGLGFCCDDKGWIVRDKWIGGRWRKVYEGRCRCWLEWRARQ